MPKTKEEKLILANLEYIGLDLKNIPDFLINYKDVEYKPEKIIEQTTFKVYRYINLKDIQILLTPVNKLGSVVEKYSRAHPLCEYLKINDILSSDLFSEIIGKLNKKEINQIEQEQNLSRNKVAFKVECDTHNLWQIYYSELTGKYFMLVSTDEANYSALFYLLKKQIECYKTGKEELLFVPITHLDYTKRYLKNEEIADIEKYIWLFTKQWPKVYEVFDKYNELTLHIVGNTNVYDDIQSLYKIELKTKPEADKFYNFIKDLFILKAELSHHYNFDTQISEKGELTLEFNNKIVSYNNLPKFIKEEYNKKTIELQKIFEEKEKTDIELEKLKEEELEKNKEYILKEKQVSTYLECRKSALGKIKYFFKGKNGKTVKSKEKNLKINNLKEENEIEKTISNAIIENKDVYNIEDLIKICIELDRIKLKIENSINNIKYLKDRLKILIPKIENATLFLQTIDKHKKSIFEFWKFSNRDLPLGLNSASEIKEKIEIPVENKEMFIYTCSNDKLNFAEENTFYTNPTTAINSMSGEKISLSKIKIKLPKEDVLINGAEIEIDMKDYKIDLKKQKIFRTNFEGEKFNFKERIVCVYEYEARK